jgi:hypothetical protein
MIYPFNLYKYFKKIIKYTKKYYVYIKMDHKNCLINPATGRAIKADSKTGQRILNAQNKKEKKKESNEAPKPPAKKRCGP